MSTNSVNKAIIVGNTGNIPEILTIAPGKKVAKFSVATSQTWLLKNGQNQEETEWHRVTAWGRLAEVCEKYLQKGRKVYVEGRFKTSQWIDDKGDKRFSTEIVATTIIFLSPSSKTEPADFSSESQKNIFSNFLPEQNDDEVPF